MSIVVPCLNQRCCWADFYSLSYHTRGLFIVDEFNEGKPERDKDNAIAWLYPFNKGYKMWYNWFIAGLCIGSGIKDLRSRKWLMGSVLMVCGVANIIAGASQ